MEKEEDQKVERVQLNVVATKLPLNPTTGEVREAYAALAEASSILVIPAISDDIAKNQDQIAGFLDQPVSDLDALASLTKFSPTAVQRLNTKKEELLDIYYNDVKEFAKKLYEVAVDCEKSVKRKLEEDLADPSMEYERKKKK